MIALTAQRPPGGPARRLSTWTMTREALTVGFDAGDRFVGRLRGSDIARFRCAGRRFIALSHPDYVDHVLHRARLRYVKSPEYEPVRAAAGINLLTDENDSLTQRMHDLATRGLRRAEKLERLGLWGLLPPPVYDGLIWCTYSGVPLPPPLRDMQKITLQLDAAVNAVIDERLAHPTGSTDLLDVLLRADNGSWPRKRVRDEALTFMLAGHETTANSMSWFWYLMALNTDARARMLDEVDTVLGGRRPTAHDLAQLPWTTACIEEALRYFSAVWILARQAVRDDVINGHHIRTGTTVIIPIHHIHHDARWWPNPKDFDPTRFLGISIDRPRSAYLPFGGGRRICIGQSFALMEMVLMAAIMSQRFTFDLVPGRAIELEATLTLRPKHGVHVVGRRRA